jgi:hypothetical protein
MILDGSRLDVLVKDAGGAEGPAFEAPPLPL